MARAGGARLVCREPSKLGGRLSAALQVQNHANQLSERRGAHLFHDPRTVNFHSALADAKIRRHDLVRLAARHEIEDFALTRSQGFEPLLERARSRNSARPV